MNHCQSYHQCLTPLERLRVREQGSERPRERERSGEAATVNINFDQPTTNIGVHLVVPLDISSPIFRRYNIQEGDVLVCGVIEGRIHACDHHVAL